MNKTTVEELRIRAAFANPHMTGDEVAREAERVQSVLEGIEVRENLRAAIEGQQADEQAQKAAEPARRAEAFNDARAIVVASHPDYDEDSVERAALHLAAENEAAIAALDLRGSLAEGFDNHSAGLGRR